MQSLFEHVLVGVDFSPAWPSLERRLARLRALGVRRLTLVHVISPRDIARPGETQLAKARQLLDKQAAALAEMGMEVSCDVSSGAPSEQLARLSAHHRTDLVLLGRQGHGLIHRLLLGSTAQNLARLTPCPLWLEPLGNAMERQAPPTIMLATDGSRAAAGAERCFARLCEHFDRRVAIIATRSLKDDAFSVGQARYHLEHLARHVAKLDFELVDGDPAEALLSRLDAWQPELLVLGQRGHGAVRERLLGSTAQVLVDKAPCPVLLVPAQPHGEAAADGVGLA
ncbi:universal stress protein [Halomonas mongoliensis]|uniref:universal stress protein n=1 Tax=Halomonas mongoliensis TaxID=321265 RepID=UPI00403AEE69